MEWNNNKNTFRVKMKRRSYQLIQCWIGSEILCSKRRTAPASRLWLRVVNYSKCTANKLLFVVHSGALDELQAGGIYYHIHVVSRKHPTNSKRHRGWKKRWLIVSRNERNWLLIVLRWFELLHFEIVLKSRTPSTFYGYSQRQIGRLRGALKLFDSLR